MIRPASLPVEPLNDRRLKPRARPDQPRASGNAPKLSIVLANYDHARFIPRALQALCAQDRPPDEIIVVDDGSTDDSLSVIRHFEERAPLLNVIVNPKNMGAIAALTRGIEAAHGRYIYLAASDDWVMPGFFKLAVDMLEAYPRAGLFCGEALLVDGDYGTIIAVRPPVRPLHRRGMVDPARARRLLAAMDNWILTGSTVFRRDVMLEAGNLDERLGSLADGYLARKIALTHGFCYAPQVVATWCVYADSFSRKTSLEVDRARIVLETVPAKLAADPVFPHWYARVFANRWRFATARLAVESVPMNCEMVRSMAVRSRLDHSVLETVRRMPVRQLSRLAILAWLWFRLRPTTLTGLVRTALARRVEKIRDKFA